MPVSLNCFKCGTVLQFATQIGRRDECGSCKSDVHCCKNCQHYDAKAYNECKEPSAEVTREKDRANFCDFFTPRTGAGAGASAQKDLQSAAEALFKKKN